MKRIRIRDIVKQTFNYFIFLIKNRGNYDYDYGYLIDTLQWRLECIRKYIVKHDRTTSTRRIDKQIKYALFLIKQYNSPGRELEKAHEERWGEIEITRIKGVHGKHNKIQITYSKADTEEENERAKEEATVVRLRQQQIQEDAKRRLFLHLDRYIENWWD